MQLLPERATSCTARVLLQREGRRCQAGGAAGDGAAARGAGQGAPQDAEPPGKASALREARRQRAQLQMRSLATLPLHASRPAFLPARRRRRRTRRQSTSAGSQPCLAWWRSLTRPWPCLSEPVCALLLTRGGGIPAAHDAGPFSLRRSQVQHKEIQRMQLHQQLKRSQQAVQSASKSARKPDQPLLLTDGHTASTPPPPQLLAASFGNSNCVTPASATVRTSAAGPALAEASRGDRAGLRQLLLRRSVRPPAPQQPRVLSPLTAAAMAAASSKLAGELQEQLQASRQALQAAELHRCATSSTPSGAQGPVGATQRSERPCSSPTWWHALGACVRAQGRGGQGARGAAVLPGRHHRPAGRRRAAEASPGLGTEGSLGKRPGSGSSSSCSEAGGHERAPWWAAGWQAGTQSAWCVAVVVRAPGLAAGSSCAR